jgi:glycerol-3-phosphate dehydrogenase (NAD(P)+)
MKQRKVAVIGAGMFGFPMANYMAELGMPVYLFDVDNGVISELAEKRKHPYHFSFLELNDSVNASSCLEETVRGADIIITAVTSQQLRNAARSFKPYLEKRAIVLNLAKGLELGSNKRLSEVLEEELCEIENCRIAALSGGMIAEEFAKKEPLFANIASKRFKTSVFLEKILTSGTFFPQASHDLVGVELAGPLKNILAIAYGIGETLEYGPSTLAGFLAVYSREVKKLAVKLGASEETFSASSQAWTGDLYATCNGKSRNKEFGRLIGLGNDPEAMLERMRAEHKSVEGYSSTKAFYDIIIDNGFEISKFPIICETYSVLYEGKKPKDAINYLIRIASQRRNGN